MACSSRFAVSNPELILELKDASSCKNTKKSINNWMKVYDSWAKSRGYKPMENYPPHELNRILEVFYAQLKKADGNDYEPDSLKVM